MISKEGYFQRLLEKYNEAGIEYDLRRACEPLDRWDNLKELEQRCNGIISKYEKRKVYWGRCGHLPKHIGASISRFINYDGCNVKQFDSIIDEFKKQFPQHNIK